MKGVLGTCDRTHMQGDGTHIEGLLNTYMYGDGMKGEDVY